MKYANATPVRRADDDNTSETRRTVIPTPRGDRMFSGWGVRF
jgi:hypothetical protein